MEIRIACKNDIPEIISVLQASLGELKLPKSVEIWEYKHLKNPFGKSLVLLAVQENKIIGVRAFMKWEWCINKDSYSTLRAVDTGILPGFQRRGIFGELNAEALKLSFQNDFIFNTPNQKSLGGNLKMGWEHIGRIRAKALPGVPFLFISSKKTSLSVPDLYKNEISEPLLENHNAIFREENKLFTPKTREFLKWRYSENPLQKYEVLCDDDFYVAAYVKHHKYFKELRVVEHIFNNENGIKKINSVIQKLNSVYRANIITYSGNMKLNFWELDLRSGPILIGRNLELEEMQWEEIKNPDYWNYSLGDLELF